MTDLSHPRKISARRAGWIAFTVLAVIVGTVYGRAAHAPFVHDDNISVLDNPSIVRQFQHALEIDPTHPDAGLAHRSLGLAWARLEQPSKAIHHLMLAMKLRPDVANDHGTLGSLLLNARRFPEAVAQLELAVRQQPTDVLGRANLAAAYANLGRWSEAVTVAEEARTIANAQGATTWAAQADAWIKTYRDRVTRR